MRWWNVSSWDIIGRLRKLEQRSTNNERNIMSQQQDATKLKEYLDGIAADIAPIKNGIDALNANLAAAIADDNPDLLKGALDEAAGLKNTFDQLAASFAKAGSPIPVGDNPAPAPAPTPPVDTSTDSGDSKPAGDDGKPADGAAPQA